jgi:hypothetical protein
MKRLSLGSFETYTRIEFTPDPLGRCSWQTFMVPNKLVNSMAGMRTALEKANASDELGEDFRMCNCSEGCDEHVSPDAAAKIMAVYFLDPEFRPSTKPMKRALLSIDREVLRLGPGDWFKRFRVDKKQANFERMPATVHYRFKKFC